HASHPAWRNAMPSLHFGSVLLATWHVWSYGPMVQIVSLVFLAGTVLATLGLGEHYLIDLVVALPFTLAVHAACTPTRDRYTQARARALVVSIGLIALWYAVLFRGTSFLHSWPVLTWGLSLATLGVVVALERGLYWSAYAPLTDAVEERHRQSRVDGSIAPGPRTWWPMGHLLSFRRDPLTLLATARDRYGDVVRFRLGWQPVHLVAHPDHVRHVLVTNQRNYDKDTRSSAKIRGVIGESLLTANGDDWLAQRRLMQPAFKPRSVAALAGVMTDATTTMLGRWESHAATGGPLDIASEMMRVTYTIVGKALFGTDVSPDIDAVALAATRVMTHTYRQVEWLVNAPAWLPTPGNLAFRRAVTELDTLVYRIIDDRQLRLGTDMVSLLLRGADEDQSGTMTRQELRNQVVSLLLAGHETTANALTWTWYLLAKHPAAARKVTEEATRVLEGRAPMVSDLERLPWIAAVIHESMRLYPPIWILERHTRDEEVIGGHRIPAGSSLLISPWVTHRHPALWDDPDAFVPARFLDDNGAGRHPFAYVPFGGGPRQCIGSHFALMEAQVIVAMVAQRFRLDLATDARVVPSPGITLRCRGGLPMVLRFRGTKS
ncbi:MAG: cytochrome P450, partial [Vicinamibacterales bacterium]